MAEKKSKAKQNTRSEDKGKRVVVSRKRKSIEDSDSEYEEKSEKKAKKNPEPTIKSPQEKENPELITETPQPRIIPPTEQILRDFGIIKDKRKKKDSCQSPNKKSKIESPTKEREEENPKLPPKVIEIDQDEDEIVVPPQPPTTTLTNPIQEIQEDEEEKKQKKQRRKEKEERRKQKYFKEFQLQMEKQKETKKKFKALRLEESKKMKEEDEKSQRIKEERLKFESLKEELIVDYDVYSINEDTDDYRKETIYQLEEIHSPSSDHFDYSRSPSLNTKEETSVINQIEEEVIEVIPQEEEEKQTNNIEQRDFIIFPQENHSDVVLDLKAFEEFEKNPIQTLEGLLFSDDFGPSMDGDLFFPNIHSDVENLDNVSETETKTISNEEEQTTDSLAKQKKNIFLVFKKYAHEGESVQYTSVSYVIIDPNVYNLTPEILELLKRKEVFWDLSKQSTTEEFLIFSFINSWLGSNKFVNGVQYFNDFHKIGGEIKKKDSELLYLNVIVS